MNHCTNQYHFIDMMSLGYCWKCKHINGTMSLEEQKAVIGHMKKAKVLTEEEYQIALENLKREGGKNLIDT